MQNFPAAIEVIQPLGSLNASNAYDFQSQMISQLKTPLCDGLVVDLGQVEFLDSAGLIALVSALKISRQLGKCFYLAAVSPSIRILFELTQLDRVFEMLESHTLEPWAA